LVAGCSSCSARDEIEFLACLHDRGAGCQSAKHAERTEVALLQQVWRGPGHERWQHRDRDVERDRLKNVEAGEPLWRDADHGERHAGETDLAADDRRVGAELLGPRLVREHHDSIAAHDAILVRNKRSPHDRLDAKDVEEICADRETDRAVNGLVAPGGKARCHEACCHEALKASSSTADVNVVRIGDAAVSYFPSGRRRAHREQLARGGHRQRPQDQPVGDAEHCRVRADADGDRHDGDE